MNEKKSILLADDDADLLDLVQTFLTGKGYDVVTAKDGEEAIAAAIGNKFDLVLLDVMMPKIDGYHVAQKLADHYGGDCPKMIMITSRDAERDERIAAASGADAILQKPLKLSLLKERIEALIGG